MIEFFKNLFRKKKKVHNPPDEDGYEHYKYTEDIDVFINRKDGVIRVEAPEDAELSQGEIVEICKKYLRGDF